MTEPQLPYIVWISYGVEGWKPEYFQTLEEALLAPKFTSEFIITKQVRFTITEVVDD
jgi:hypothetical protein